MDELAVMIISEEQVPKNLELLRDLLIEHGLEGHYTINGEFLQLNNEDGQFEFNLFPSTIGEPFGTGPGIEIAGDFGDEIAAIIELQEVFEAAFPDGEFSSVYDD